MHRYILIKSYKRFVFFLTFLKLKCLILAGKLGGKGANLAEMASIGLSVPPGLTISTEACRQYQIAGKKLPEGLWDEIVEGLSFIESDIGASLADPSKPLLLSVRSGAAVSIDTFLFFFFFTTNRKISFFMGYKNKRITTIFFV